METELRRRLVRSILPLLGLTVVCAGLIGAGQALLGDRIAENRRMAPFAVVREAMPLEHDNDLLRDRIEIDDAAQLGTRGTVSVFRARRNGEPVGLVFMPVTARGYNGRVELAVGIAEDGTVAAVRVTRHDETEGLGDQVHQSHTGWINGFAGRSLAETPPEDWAVESDGGKFDQISGATITPRGVINAVHSALEYYQLNREILYSPPE